MGGATIAVCILGCVPAKTIEFLHESYQSLYTGFDFNWTMIVEKADTP